MSNNMKLVKKNYSKFKWKSSSYKEHKGDTTTDPIDIKKKMRIFSKLYANKFHILDETNFFKSTIYQHWHKKKKKIGRSFYLGKLNVIKILSKNIISGLDESGWMLRKSQERNSSNVT